MGGWQSIFTYLLQAIGEKGVMPMTIFEAMTVTISFATLIVSILALSFTFSQKK